MCILLHVMHKLVALGLLSSTVIHSAGVVRRSEDWPQWSPQVGTAGLVPAVGGPSAARSQVHCKTALTTR